MLGKEEHQRGHKEPVPAAASQALPYIQGLTPLFLCLAAASPFPPPHPRRCACGWSSQNSPGGSGLSRADSSSSPRGRWRAGGGDRPPKSKASQWRWWLRGRQRPSRTRGWAYEEPERGKKGNLPPRGARRRRRGRRGRRRSQAEDALSPVRD